MHAGGMLLVALLTALAGPGAQNADSGDNDTVETAGSVQATSGEAAGAGDATKPAETEEEPCQVALMNLQSKGLPDSQKHVAALLTDTMAAELASTGKCKVITQSDIMQMLDFEASKAAVCNEESDSCLAEVGGALGVDRVIGGSVGMLGSSFKLQVKLQNVREGKVEARVDELIKGEPELLDAAARNAARKLFGLEPIAGTDDATSADPAQSDDKAATASDGNGDGAAAETAAAEGDGVLGTALLTAGAVGIGVGLVVALAAAATAGGSEVLRSVPLDATRSLKDFKDLAFYSEVAGLAFIVVGAVVVVGGAGVATAGLFVE